MAGRGSVEYPATHPRPQIKSINFSAHHTLLLLPRPTTAAFACRLSSIGNQPHTEKHLLTSYFFETAPLLISNASCAEFKSNHSQSSDDIDTQFSKVQNSKYTSCWLPSNCPLWPVRLPPPLRPNVIFVVSLPPSSECIVALICFTNPSKRQSKASVTSNPAESNLRHC